MRCLEKIFQMYQISVHFSLFPVEWRNYKFIIEQFRENMEKREEIAFVDANVTFVFN